MSIIDPNFYKDCLDHHRKVSDLNFVVRKSLPIPYFGDVAGYAKSPLKVLTAALNPSNAEFPADNPRFDIERGRMGAGGLEAELSAYFRCNPYCRWFRSFELVLNGLCASYGGRMADGEFRHTALHIDMCSPIATSPTWSKLKSDQRTELTATGFELCERLVDALKPDIIIASLSWRHIEGWHAAFQTGHTWEPIRTYETTFDGRALRRPLLVQARSLTSRSGHAYLFANGSAANTPFGQFHNDRKRTAGLDLHGLVRQAALQPGEGQRGQLGRKD